MNIFRAVCWLSLMVAGRFAMAQFPTTVQLPTFQQFSMSTTVMVPDRGGVYAGGVNRSWCASRSRGLPLVPIASRPSDCGTIASGVSVHATIHDLNAMDKMVLGRWEQLKKSRPTKARIPRRSPRVDQQRVSVPELRRRIQAEEAASLAKAQADYQSGLRWEQKGRPALSKLYFQRALSRDPDAELQDKVRSRLRVAENTRNASRNR